MILFIPTDYQFWRARHLQNAIVPLAESGGVPEWKAPPRRTSAGLVECSFKMSLSSTRWPRVTNPANATGFTCRLLLTFQLCTPHAGLARRFGWIGGASEKHQTDYDCEPSGLKTHSDTIQHLPLRLKKEKPRQGEP
jgi:hypothetical protein